jgi:hypothetical protein
MRSFGSAPLRAARPRAARQAPVAPRPAPLPSCRAVREARGAGAGASGGAAPCVAEVLAREHAIPGPTLQSAIARCPELLETSEGATRRVQPIMALLAGEGFDTSDAVSALLLKCPQVRRGARRRAAAGGKMQPPRAGTRPAAWALHAAPPPLIAPARPLPLTSSHPPPPSQLATYCPSRAEESLAFLSDNLGLSPRQRAEVVRRFPQVRARARGARARASDRTRAGAARRRGRCRAWRHAWRKPKPAPPPHATTHTPPHTAPRPLHPQVLGYGVKSWLIPQLAFLKSLGATEEGLPGLVMARPQVLGSNILRVRPGGGGAGGRRAVRAAAARAGGSRGRPAALAHPSLRARGLTAARTTTHPCAARRPPPPPRAGHPVAHPLPQGTPPQGRLRAAPVPPGLLRGL